MKKHLWYDSRWTIRQFRMGEIIWEMVDEPNILVDSGERLFGEVVLRDNSSSYFGMTNFYTGLCRGTISESTVLSTIPNEPSGNGYSRQVIERSTTGWPTVQQDDGDWMWTSKEISLTASGGNIGPIDHAFLCTSSDDTGSLISAVATNVERTILSGDTITFQMKIKLK